MRLPEGVNPNVFLAQVFVNELVQQGVETVCISPGSRSTPLTLAFSERASELSIRVIIDERSASFYAVGAAKLSGRPSVLVCTSGTALANYLPAIMEAERSKVPLLVLSADRPHELRDTGANQTMDQLKLFGGHVKWFVDMVPPRRELSPSYLRLVRTTAARAYNHCVSGPRGVVHINFPFSKPLEPAGRLQPLAEVTSDLGIVDIFRQPLKFLHGAPDIQEHLLDEVVELLAEKDRGVIVVGPFPEFSSEFFATVNVLADMLGYPILADPLSNLRYRESQRGFVVTGYESFFQSAEVRELCRPEVIIHVGDLPTSRYLLTYLKENQDVDRVTFQEDGEWRDDTLSTNYFFKIAPDRALLRLTERFERRRAERPLLELFTVLEEYHVRMVERFVGRERTDATVVSNVVRALPSGSTLVVSNSLPVRHVDQFCPASCTDIKVVGNRGLSGIDGLIATASGVASVSSSSVNVLLIGDIAFLHDLNSLLTVRRYRPNLTIVLLNNSGGGIFHRLPIRGHEQVFEDYFLAAQDVDFTGVSHLFGIRIRAVESLKELKSLLLREQLTREPVILEFRTDSHVDEEVRSQFMEKYLSELRVHLRNSHLL